MPDYLQLLDFVASASHGVFRFLRAERAAGEARAYLVNKYGLTFRHERMTSFAAGATTEMDRWDDSWRVLAERLLREVRAAETPSDAYCKSCGDLALLIAACPSSAWEEYPGKGADAHWQALVAQIKGTELHKSLLEMGRGRGNEYAVRLIADGLANQLNSAH